MLPALALLAAVMAGRMAYPRMLERRQKRRRDIGADGVVHGAGAIDLPREAASGLLLLHGGGDTPQALEQMAGHLHAHGFAIRAPLLSSHGRHLSALATSSAQQWHAEVRSEYESMRTKHDKVALVGLSMGGALAVTLASHCDVDALVLLAPYLAMPPLARRMAQTSHAWGWLLPYFSSLGTRSIRDPAAASRSLGHGILTPSTLRAFYDVVEDAATALPRVRAPALVIHSRGDNRISRDSAEDTFARLGSREKRLEWTDGAAHVITVDFGHERVFELTADWLTERLRPAS
jgi:carboxylesterase